MQFPVNWSKRVTMKEELRDIQKVDAPASARAVAKRSEPRVFRQDSGPQRTDAERVRAEQRRDRGIEQERRKVCRRLYNKPVMLDTRSGKDRREQSRRDEDITTNIAILG